MSSAGGILTGDVQPASVAVIQKRTRFRRVHPEVAVLFESPCHAGNVDVPLLDMPRCEKMAKRVEFFKILPVNHRCNGHLDIGLVKVVNGRETFLEGSFPSERLVSFLHSIEANLHFMDLKFSGDVSGDQHSIGEEYRPEGVMSQPLVEYPELGVKQRFPSGEEEA
jgi:hypothetical protein